MPSCPYFLPPSAKQNHYSTVDQFRDKEEIELYDRLTDYLLLILRPARSHLAKDAENEKTKLLVSEQKFQRAAKEKTDILSNTT